MMKNDGWRFGFVINHVDDEHWEMILKHVKKREREKVDAKIRSIKSQSLEEASMLNQIKALDHDTMHEAAEMIKTLRRRSKAAARRAGDDDDDGEAAPGAREVRLDAGDVASGAPTASRGVDVAPPAPTATARRATAAAGASDVSNGAGHGDEHFKSLGATTDRLQSALFDIAENLQARGTADRKKAANLRRCIEHMDSMIGNIRGTHAEMLGEPLLRTEQSEQEADGR